jgi:hypothetical protein
MNQNVMPHQGPKRDGNGGLAIQVTEVARDNGFIWENDEGRVTKRAEDLYVYTFDALCLIINTDLVDGPDRAELVAMAARETESIYSGVAATVADAGNGYKVALPDATRAGFSLEDGYTEVNLRGFPGVICVYKAPTMHLVDDLKVVRTEQLNARNDRNRANSGD